MMTNPGKTRAQGVVKMNEYPSFIMEPQLGVGGCSPIPR